MKKGKIIIEEQGFNDGKRNPGAEFEGKGNKVYSCSSGIVKSIDTTSGRLVVYVEFDNYSFSYHNLKSVLVSKEQPIKAGALLGLIMDKEKLFLIVSENKALIQPERILKCKTVHRYL